MIYLKILFLLNQPTGDLIDTVWCLNFFQKVYMYNPFNLALFHSYNVEFKHDTYLPYKMITYEVWSGL